MELKESRKEIIPLWNVNNFIIVILLIKIIKFCIYDCDDDKVAMDYIKS